MSSLKVKVSLMFTAKQPGWMCGTKFPLVDTIQHHRVRAMIGKAPTFHACKHVFAIFRHEPDWGFQKLCENYRNSPFFTLDEDPVNNIEPVAEFPIDERMTAESEESVDTQANVDKENLPLPNRFNKTVAAQCRDLMNQAKSLTYISDDTDILRQVKNNIENCVMIMEKTAPKASDGIIPEQGESSKPAPRDTPKAQPKKISKPLLKRLPLATRKIDLETEVGGDDLPEVNPPPSRNDKGDTVIADDNSSDPSVWIDHRDHTAGNKVTL
ncbi:hypothetical protein OS493_007324 [Desmophyllum pertusum]|uniref:Uncharacterized protein n=1 Tax=Desmophyllum pertusum TaxID=174260 RepID=A0A9W9Z3F5_9CNID|nr:hypothetical protein OS493_007324 [Desmophyllum pertusum]